MKVKKHKIVDKEKCPLSIISFQYSPTEAETKVLIDHLPIVESPTELWSAIADELEEIGRPKRSVVFWKRAFTRMFKRVQAKNELRHFIVDRHQDVIIRNPKLCELASIENEFLLAWTSSLMISSRKDISTHCRVCLTSTNGKMRSLFDKTSDDERSPLEKLDICGCLTIEAQRDDGMPQLICADCSGLLENAYQFKMLCMKTEEKLRELNVITKSSVSRGEMIEMEQEQAEVHEVETIEQQLR